MSGWVGGWVGGQLIARVEPQSNCQGDGQDQKVGVWHSGKQQQPISRFPAGGPLPIDQPVASTEMGQDLALYKKFAKT